MKLKFKCTFCGVKRWFWHYLHAGPTEHWELLPRATDKKFHTCKKCYKRLKPWLKKRVERDAKLYADERQKLLNEQKKFLMEVA